MIKNDIITCNGYEAVDNARLEKLFHPERHGNQRTQKKFQDEAKKLFSRPFFAAQLRFYGITFPRSATEAQLHSLLDKAVVAKQVGPAALFTPMRPYLHWPELTQHGSAFVCLLLSPGFTMNSGASMPESSTHGRRPSTTGTRCGDADKRRPGPSWRHLVSAPPTTWAASWSTTS